MRVTEANTNLVWNSFYFSHENFLKIINFKQTPLFFCFLKLFFFKFLSGCYCSSKNQISNLSFLNTEHLKDRKTRDETTT